MCASGDMFLKYKNDTRKTLDMTTTDKETLEKKKRHEFEKIRAKFNLSLRGIDSFSLVELKRLYEYEAITRHVYRR
jgi:hypothetical protein